MTLRGSGYKASLDVKLVFIGPESYMKVIGLAGWSGAGKTTLLTRLIPYFIAQDLRVSVIKHAIMSSTWTCPARIHGFTVSRGLLKCWCLRPSVGH
jgi:Ni2+-binding GTPase involved in maturation of urease and hydrogenase